MGKFKVGDRVRLTKDNSGFGSKGDVGAIDTIDAAGNAYVKFETGTWAGELWWVPSGGFQHVAVAPQQQITIKASKFYRTRDGRKVGPMRSWSEEAKYRWEADDDDLPYIWADDGTEIDSDIYDGADIIAEADEPANDNGSTAGFTVPLCAYEDEPGWYVTELGRAYADGYAAGLRASQAQAA